LLRGSFPPKNDGAISGFPLAGVESDVIYGGCQTSLSPVLGCCSV